MKASLLCVLLVALLGLCMVAGTGCLGSDSDSNMSGNAQLIVQNNTSHGMTVTVRGVGSQFATAGDTLAFSVKPNTTHTVTSDRGHSRSVYVGSSRAVVRFD